MEEEKFPEISVDDVQELFAPEGEHAALRQEAASLPKLLLTAKQLCDLELLLIGGFRPLDGFLRQDDYDSVVKTMRLSSRFNGAVWPMPITLDVEQEVPVGARVGLWDGDEDRLLALMTVESCWRPDLEAEAAQVFGKTDQAHPAVAHLLKESKKVYIGGPLQGIVSPSHYDFTGFRRTPRELRAHFRSHGWTKVVAFQTRNPMHRSHRELTVRASERTGSALLIQPVVGRTKPGDVDHFTRVRCYQKMLKHYPETTVLSLLPLAMRMGGPREALWHALIRRNYGCTHFIVGRDHAGPGNDSDGKPFYDPYGAQDLVHSFASEIGIEMVPFKEVVFVENRQSYATIDEVDESKDTVLRISGTELRRRLYGGLPIPEWFSFAEVIAELRKQYPARASQGLVVLLRGPEAVDQVSVFAKGLQHVMLSKGKIVTVLTDALEPKTAEMSSEKLVEIVAQLVKCGGAVLLLSTEGGRGTAELCPALGGLLEVAFHEDGIEVHDERDKMDYAVPMGLQAAKEHPHPFVEKVTTILSDAGFLEN